MSTLRYVIIFLLSPLCAVSQCADDLKIDKFIDGFTTGALVAPVQSTVVHDGVAIGRRTLYYKFSARGTSTDKSSRIDISGGKLSLATGVGAVPDSVSLVYSGFSLNKSYDGINFGITSTRLATSRFLRIRVSAVSATARYDTVIVLDRRSYSFQGWIPLTLTRIEQVSFSFVSDQNGLGFTVVPPDFNCVGGGVVPVVFEWIRGENGMLCWKTAFQSDVKSFEVQKKEGDFVTVATIPPNTSGLYSFPANGGIYRIKQVDQDGGATYSPIVNLIWSINEEVVFIGIGGVVYKEGQPKPSGVYIRKQGMEFRKVFVSNQ